MKTRSGFVSNSSSSSFIYILSAEKYEKLLAELDIYQREVLKKLRTQRTKILDQDAVVVSGVHGNYSSFDDISIDVDDNELSAKYDDCPEEAFNQIQWPEGTYSGGESF